MRSRVMPGSLVTMERRVPVKRLKSVDLPTLGRPTMTRDGRRSGISSWAGRTMGAAAGRVTFQCSAFRGAPEGRCCFGGWGCRKLTVESPKKESELTQRSQRTQSSRSRNGTSDTRLFIEGVQIPLKGKEL